MLWLASENPERTQLHYDLISLLPPPSSLPIHTVVQLFNAVSQHKKEVEAKVKAAGPSERKKAKGGGLKTVIFLLFTHSCYYVYIKYVCMRVMY